MCSLDRENYTYTWPYSTVHISDEKKHFIDISYNVKFSPITSGLLVQPKSKQFEGVKNKSQGLFTVECLKEALPTVQQQCELFGLSFYGHNYIVTNPSLLDSWCKYTEGNLDKFL